MQLGTTLLNFGTLAVPLLACTQNHSYVDRVEQPSYNLGIILCMHVSDPSGVEGS